MINATDTDPFGRGPAGDRKRRRARWAWMWFDWATQPYHTLITAFIFAPYFATGLMDNAVEGQKIWGLMQGLTGLAIALAAPVLGAWSDRTGKLKTLIFGISILYLTGCMAMWSARPGEVMIAAFAVMLAGFAVEILATLTNSLLPRLAEPGRVGALSGNAWALGFVGGLVSLAMTLVFLAPAAGSDLTLAGIEPLFGLTVVDGGPARATGPLSAIWYVIFASPLFLFIPATLSASATNAPRGIVDAVRRLADAKGLLRFLVARLAFQDALLAVFAFGGIYGAGTLGWGTTELGAFGILLTVTGAIGASAGGWLDDRLGSKPVIIAAILMCLAALAIIASLSTPDAPATSLFSRSEDKLFLLGGTLVGIAAGPMQSAARTYLVALAPRDEIATAFGLYAMSGKAVAFTGPLLVSAATALGGTQRAGLIPIAILFVIGLAILTSVPRKV